jgi:hypothetical protein
VARFIKAGQFTSYNDKFTGGIKLPAGVTSKRAPTPLVGEIRYNTTSNNLEFYNGSSYQNVAVKGAVTITKDSFTGDGSTTVFTLSITPADENNILVFVGNVHQNPNVAYTLSGSTLTFSSPPPDTQTIIVLHGFDSTSV